MTREEALDFLVNTVFTHSLSLQNGEYRNMGAKLGEALSALGVSPDEAEASLIRTRKLMGV